MYCTNMRFLGDVLSFMVRVPFSWEAHSSGAGWQRLVILGMWLSELLKLLK